MISFKLREVFIPSVLLVQFVSVVRFNEGVLLARRKECRNETLTNVINGRELVQIEMSLIFN